jgi:hypothetical protein
MQQLSTTELQLSNAQTFASQKQLFGIEKDSSKLEDAVR